MRSTLASVFEGRRSEVHVALREGVFDRFERLTREFTDWCTAPYIADDEGDDEETAEADGPNAPPEADQSKTKAELERPERPLLQRLVNSNGFEACSMMSIILCMFFLGADAACFNCQDGTKVFYEVMNQLFVLAFLVEWFLRVAKDGKKYFLPLRAEHILDTLIVWVCGVLLGWIIPLTLQDVQRSPITQSLNVLRSMRTLRFFAFLKHFDTFKMLLAGLLGTQATLAACVVLLAMLDLLFGIIAIELIGRFEAWGLAERGSAAWNFQNGLIPSCMAMTRFIFWDNASDFLAELLEKQPYIWIFCFCYIAISAYVILNLVTAVICRKAHSMSQANLAERAKELREEEKKTLKDLKKLFLKLDADGSGQVSFEEFGAAFRIPEIRPGCFPTSPSQQLNVKYKFVVLGFDEEEAKRLFKVLDADGEGELSVSEFTKGMAEVKGEATAKGMLIAKKKAEKLEKLLVKLLPEDAHGGVEGEVLQEAEPERVGELLETQMRGFEEAANLRLDELERQCAVAKNAAKDLEELMQTSKAKLAKQRLMSHASALF